MHPDADLAVVGGGIVGAAVAAAYLDAHPGARVVLLEKEAQLAAHQTGRNSGVVHAGIYYQPGSLKAVLCRRGVGLLRDYCAARGLPYDEVGKLVVARGPDEVPGLERLHARAERNGVPGLRRVDAVGIAEIEPHVAAVAALHSPTTAITDFAAVTRALAADVVAGGGEVRTGAEVTGLGETTSGVEVVAGGVPVRARAAVVCAGLQSDRLARLAGADRDPAIVPFRGEYHRLRADRAHLVRGLVYPVPDPRYPFLGVHLTRHVRGEVLVGPNAVLALAREGYRWRDVEPRVLAELARWPGSWAMAARHWRTGVREVYGSLRRAEALRQARSFVPELGPGDLLPGPAGVRAQALGRDGELVDDFRLEQRGPITLVRNAPSPAATSSLAIAEYVLARLPGTVGGRGQG